MTRLKESLKTKKTVLWSLMCPNDCPGLTDTYGTEFEQLYLSYEAQGKFRRQISIKKLWDMITATQIETGKPYLMYKDHVNRKCNQNNLGVIKSSNLCVSGDTKILTTTGYVPIETLAGKIATVWNGYEWSESPVEQTGSNRTLYRVTMSDGSVLDCTGYHKFYVKDDFDSLIERRAMDLRKGDRTEEVKYFPVCSSNTNPNDPRYQSDKLRNDEIPFDFRIFSRLIWLARQIDVDAGCLQITSDNIDWLRQIKLFSNALGTAPFIVESPRGYHLRYNSGDVEYLIDELLMPINKTTSDYRFVSQPELSVESVVELEGRHNTFCFNEPVRHRGVFNGIYTGNCSEITIYSDTNNIGVCNLASICLPKFVKNGQFDYEHLNQITQKIVINMDKVMDNNKYPLDQAKHSDNQNRPIGVGVQGLSEVFMMLKTPFDSPLAMDVNKKIFETIYYGALVASNQLSQLHGPYKTFASSMTASGTLQFDLWDVTPSDLWDWTSLKRDIITHGLRNSLLTAIMPTAGTSIIMGHTESVEPPQSNIFTRSTLSGRFQVVNKHLMNDLKAIGLWTKSIRNRIIQNDGSVQSIEEIPQNIRDIYKTVYEYKLTSFIKMCGSRESYICQSSSNNRYLDKPDVGVLTNMHLFSWKAGLKTSSYYIRIRQQSFGKQYLDADKEEEECLSCSA